MSEDPIGFAGGDYNLNRFVGNSPTNATDPYGLFGDGGGKPFQASGCCMMSFAAMATGLL
jgi:hypothetical protein